MNIVHIAYEHRADDVRIYIKECMSLAHNCYNVTYITTKHENEVFKEEQNCHVKVVPYTSIHYSRLRQPVQFLFKGLKARKEIKKKIIQMAVSENPTVCHVHEYSLLKVGKEIQKKTNVKLVYDVHEDVPRQMENNSFNRSAVFKLLKKIESFIVEKKENAQAKRYDLIVAATPHIKSRFSIIHKNVITVCNYPIMRENINLGKEKKSNNICYVGTIYKARGIESIVKAISDIDVGLLLGGRISADYLEVLNNLDGWKNVNALGFIGREEVEEVMRESFAGIFVPFPTGNIINAFPVKIFEYMYEGIPVIASNFDTYRHIVEDNRCGICVDPYNISSIKKAILYLKNNPVEAQKMGKNGHDAVLERYHWKREETKLLKAYKSLLEM